MREIKFRAWDNKQKVFVDTEVCYMKLDDGWVYNHHLDDGYDDVILMQYTGLKDKNGREIYEGDILRFKTFDPNADREDEKFIWVVAQVVWWQPGCAWYVQGQISNYLSHIIKNGLEVIGNIWDNPELLKTGGFNNE